VAISIDDLAADTGWTAVESHGYIGEESCEFVFEEAEVNVVVDTYGQTIQAGDTLLQLRAFEKEESVTEDQLADAAVAVARASVEVL
jgi:hypothetical protein